MEHIFGDIKKQLESLKADKMYKYKIVASYNGGKFKEIAWCKTEEETIMTMEANRTKYGTGWVVTYYNIEN